MRDKKCEKNQKKSIKLKKHEKMILFSEIVLSALIFNLYYFEKCDFGIGVLKVFLMILGIPKSQFTVSKQHFGPHKMISAVSKIMSTHRTLMWAGTSNFAI